jgi:hypothetical protein
MSQKPDGVRAHQANVATQSPTGTCKLCEQQAVLKKSHIIPNAYFKKMKNKEGKLVSFDMELDTNVDLSQDSWYETLLCGECEGRFSVLETKWIGRLRHVNQAFMEGAKQVKLPEFEYDSFRRFLLSILWRASVSTQVPFRSVDLTATEGEQLRAALLAGSTISVTKWAILIRKVQDTVQSLELEQLLMQPTKLSAAGTNRYRFIFGGFVVDFFDQPMTTLEGLVLATATLPIYSIEMTEVPEIMLAGVMAIHKNNRGLTDKRITPRPAN